MIPLVSRAAIVAQLRAWASGDLDAAALKAWVEGVRSDDPGPREALAELDLLEVHLLTPDDAAALIALVDSDDTDETNQMNQTGIANSAWSRHRAAIDLDLRSRALRKNPLYRPFCR